MNKLVYLGLSTLEISKIVMYEFWNDYLKPKYGEKTKLCYIDTDSLMVYIKKYIYLDIEEDLETRIHTSNYKLNRSLTKENNKKVIGLMKDELREKIMTEFPALRPKMHNYLTNDNDDHK